MKFAIVCSRFNSEYTDALLSATEAGLKGHTVKALRVPGAFEIPYALSQAARSKKYDAIIALGLIWHGETDHGSLIAAECARACMSLSLEYDVPVIFEVLTVRTVAQAKARCLGKKLNRGTEAAKTALEMAEFRA